MELVFDVVNEVKNSILDSFWIKGDFNIDILLYKCSRYGLLDF